MELFELTNPELYVLLALVVFFGILVFLKVLPGVLFKALDGHAARIQAELDEAQRLREEAAALLAGVHTQRAEAEKQAAEMIANARDEAKRASAEAKTKLDEQIVRRAALAERKIANAEAQAAAEVKAVAAEMAAQLAEQVLTARLAASKSDPLIDKAISQVGSKLQ